LFHKTGNYFFPFPYPSHRTKTQKKKINTDPTISDHQSIHTTLTHYLTMKYSSVSILAFLAALHQSHALTRPRQASLLANPQEQAEQRHQLDDSSSSLGLLVDGEGNLYYQASSMDRQNVAPRTSSPTAILAGLRGGALAVDKEGCLYTPRSDLRTAKARSADTDDKPSPLASPTESLRGGSKNNRFGGLCVDAEGNLYASQVSSSGALESLRGGALEVDKEGNFYSLRSLPKQEPELTPLLTKTLDGNRRGNNHKRETEGASSPDQGRILLAKNKIRRKKTTEDKPKESPPQSTKAFIGFNNALMET